MLACDEKDSSELEKIRLNAMAVGVKTELLTTAQIQEEPNVRAKLAMLVPDTGILDSHHYMQTLAQILEHRGADIALG